MMKASIEKSGVASENKKFLRKKQARFKNKISRIRFKKKTSDWSWCKRRNRKRT